MFIFAILIVLSIVFYVYYKVSILRTKDGLTQRYLNAKSRMSLGVFLVSFGINQYLAYQVKFVLIISIIFFILGCMQIMYGFKSARHYRNEWKRLNP